MFDFRGAVYIFENPEVQRVKVGTTWNPIASRLDAINDMWLGRKVTCQVCAGRLVNLSGYVPQHVVSGNRCPGGNALPLERDIAVAESHLASLEGRHGELSGDEMGSNTRRIKTLKRRIELYRDFVRAAGSWKYRVGFYTKSAGDVESRAHAILAERLDKRAPFGEVFSCSVAEAAEAVESALNQLGLSDSARREDKLA
ncbi:MAG: hypothetical protein M0D55_08000 [Elusimicrobiota bacterium]|nr:MAG: hypothetical protein M0D55_08000 [Elusimicrobiota bacterium]